MQAVLIIVHLFVAIALIFVVLLQRSEGGALGMGGGGSGLGGLFSPRGAASTLSRTTAFLGIAFFATSLALTLLALGSRRPASILNPASVRELKSRARLERRRPCRRGNHRHCRQPIRRRDFPQFRVRLLRPGLRLPRCRVSRRRARKPFADHNELVQLRVANALSRKRSRIL